MPTHRPDPLARSPGARALRAAPAVLLLLVLGSCESPVDPSLEIVPSEAVVELRAIRGQSTPVSRTITVANTGGGRLGPVTCLAEPAPWLTCAVANGNAVTLTANPVGLVTDPQRVPVTLTAPGGSATIEVALAVEQPALTVSPTTVAFTATEVESGTTPTSAAVTVTNTGAGGLADLGAITCGPTPAAPRVTCSVDQSAGVLTVAVDPVGLGPGTHIFPLTVAAEHSSVPQTVSVTLAVSALPRIGLSRQSVHIEATRGSTAAVAQTVVVSNLGGGTLSAVTCPAQPAAWLTCSVSGSTVTLTASPAGLTASPTPVSVPISVSNAVNSPQSVNVTFAINQPVLALDRSSVGFSVIEGSSEATPGQDTVRVSNTGAGDLANLGAITCQPPAESPVTCEVGSGGVLLVSVNPEDLPRGSHTYPLDVSAAHSSVTRVLSVTVNVTTAPTLVLKPSPLTFLAIRGTTAAMSQTVAISNPGGGSLGTISCPENPTAWLTCTVNDSTLLTITAHPSGLTSSPAPASVQITASGAANSPVSLPVTLILEQPVLAVSAHEIAFTGNAGTGATDPASIVVAVTNVGAGTLANLGTISCVIAAPATCVVSQGAGELTLSVNPTGLAPGRHVWVATVSAPHASNGSVTITLVLDVS
jgi:hypothetical protein